MTMRDSRVFRDDEDRMWVAQVHSQAGAAYLGEREDDAIIPMISETALITCLSDEELNSRVLQDLGIGQLLKMGHDEIVCMLRKAPEMDSRIKLRPFGLVDPAEFENRFSKFGLSWGYKVVRWAMLFPGDDEEMVKRKTAIEVACFDDSALRGTVNLITPEDRSWTLEMLQAGAQAFAAYLFEGREDPSGSN